MSSKNTGISLEMHPQRPASTNSGSISSQTPWFIEKITRIDAESTEAGELRNILSANDIAFKEYYY